MSVCPLLVILRDDRYYEEQRSVLTFDKKTLEQIIKHIIINISNNETDNTPHLIPVQEPLTLHPPIHLI